MILKTPTSCCLVDEGNPPHKFQSFSNCIWLVAMEVHTARPDGWYRPPVDIYHVAAVTAQTD
jgi:hypothetical protein